MPSGATTRDSLADSVDDVVASARIASEHVGVMKGLVETEDLEPGTQTWKESTLAPLTAGNVGETTEENTNYQQLTDSAFSITPTLIQIVTLITALVARQLNRKAFAKTGVLAGNAIGKKQNSDLLTSLDGATTSLGGTATTVSYSVPASAVARIRGNVTEPADGDVFYVDHPYAFRDLYAEATAPFGTYDVSGMAAQTFQKGFKNFAINTAKCYEDGNIVIDSTPDAKGGIFARKALVLVQDLNLRRDVEWKPRVRGGSNIVTLTMGYGIGERSAGNWLYEYMHDATVPT